MNCKICNKQLTGKQRTFCSRKCHNKDGNTRYQNYQSQQKRGLDRKIKLINLLGGKCSTCGYLKNVSALHFHHLDPKEKEGRLDMRKLSNSTWEYCLSEAKKCQLLCANCHAEHHHPQLTFSKNPLVRCFNQLS